MISEKFWKNKKVFITGHTGFKGSWLCLLLNYLGAEVTGYALTPPTEPSLFELCQLSQFTNSIIADIRDADCLDESIISAAPEIVIHMAAQPIVRESYKSPVETYSVNVMGTVNLLEAVRKCKSIKAVVNVTTDKCYENKEWLWNYRENEPLGGHDPYSCSKACSELVTSSYRASYFTQNGMDFSNAGIASARAGNVIGGGDWAKDRLIPDCIVALLKGEKIIIRSPHAVRPWQYVLEPLSGYLILAQRLYEDKPNFAEAWNFGPNDSDAKEVEWIVKRMCEKWGDDALYEIDKNVHPHEAGYLKLDCSKAKKRLGWYPKWDLGYALDKVLGWTKAYKEGSNLTDICLKQINEYVSCNSKIN